EKTFASHTGSDASVALAGHTLALARQWHAANNAAPGIPVGDFGNWTLPLLATRLSSDQPETLAGGATSPWAVGARVWLSIPGDLADAKASLTHLSFTLGAQSERLGAETDAPRIWHPAFTTDRGWMLQARASDERRAVDNLQRQGDRLYEQGSGLPWVPNAYSLTAPDGTCYALDAQGRIVSVRFTDGQAWLVSDAGIAAIGGDFNERMDFQRDGAGRIVRITTPAADTGNSLARTAIAYRYDSAGRLILVRHLGGSDLGTPIAYDATGAVVTGPLTANLGTAANWASSNASTWRGELTADTKVELAFSVRESEIASTIHAPGSDGAVILVLETMLPADGLVEVAGAQIVGSTAADRRVSQLLRVTEAGVKLVRLSGTGAAQVSISVAGDLSGDGQVDAVDSRAWERAATGQDLLADIDGDDRIGSADRQLLYANLGFRA
ncbi:MAG: hypothetical protein KDI64_07000, partial [Candidatus Accumulibacter sp.]|nr:hypothetical protein [Accumulibacter sp.]